MTEKLKLAPEVIESLLVRVLEAVPVAIPEWAIGTPLYFQPRKHSALQLVR